MKRFALLSLLTIMAGTIAASTYEGLLQNFKEQLYNRQTMLMSNQEKYFAFITPILKQAEVQLRIPKYLKQNPNCPLAQEYFACLLNYNVYCFELYIQDAPVARAIDSYCYDRLHNVIAKIVAEMTKAPDNMVQTVIEQEAINTAHFLYNANATYYEQLSWRIKSAIAISSFFTISDRHPRGPGGPAVTVNVTPRR